VSYAANGFLFAADLKSRRALVDTSALGISGVTMDVGSCPDEGGQERFAALGLRMSVERPLGAKNFRIAARARGLTLEASLDTSVAPRPLTLIAPVPGGVVNVTQKSVGLLATGSLRLDGTNYSLDGGFGGFDYTHGLLARHTDWRWAFATGRTRDGRIVGFNLVDGFNDAIGVGENVLWVGSAMVPVSSASFRFDATDPLATWNLSTSDGRVDLRFEPTGEHLEDRNLLVAKSHFRQAYGTFRGTVDVGSGPIEIECVPGVAEDQQITW